MGSGDKGKCRCEEHECHIMLITNRVLRSAVRKLLMRVADLKKLVDDLTATTPEESVQEIVQEVQPEVINENSEGGGTI